MIKRPATRTAPRHSQPELSLKDSYRLLRKLPLGAASDHELEQISDQISELSNRNQIAALMARIHNL